jgi:hypothetical protein
VADVNHLYYGDNLHVLRDSIATESVDLVYLDPLFNSQATYNVLPLRLDGEIVASLGFLVVGTLYAVWWLIIAVIAWLAAEWSLSQEARQVPPGFSGPKTWPRSVGSWASCVSG